MSRDQTALTPTPVPPAPAGRAPRRPAFPAAASRVPGRPKHLTPETREKIMTALRAGNTMAAAARYAGLKPKTVERWLRIGRGVERLRPATPEYVDFYRLAEESQATAEVYVVGNLVARTRVDTRAAEVWLKAHGGPEWRVGPETPPAPTATFIDAREQTVQMVILPPEQVPDVVRQLLAQRRNEMPEEAAIVTEERRPDGPSRARTAGLREDI